MMRVVVVLLLVSVWGCGSAVQMPEVKEQEKADYHLNFADSLETAGAFQGAALVYKMVAELYPGTMFYANAVRNLGHLYINPFNTARNDSISLFWLTKHLELSWLPRGERTRSVILSALIRERMLFSSSSDKRLSVIDSLTSLTRIQSAELKAQSKKISELTAELEQTDTDLQILLEFQKNPTVARRDSLNLITPTGQRLATAEESESARRKADETSEQLQKLREIDLRALQRRSKR